MSATIDERVVEMKFNNRDFEQNAKTSISTIERLKQALNFTASANGLDNVSNAVKRVDMNSLGTAVDSVKMKFSALQIAAVTALSNIVNRAVNAGIQVARAFTIDPIVSGFNEYEQKLGSIQTILANTQGQTGKVSQEAIQEVNTAAEQAAAQSEALNQQAISNLQKRQNQESKAIEKSGQAQQKALQKSQKKQTKALQKSQKEKTKALEKEQKEELAKLSETQEKKQEELEKAQKEQLETLTSNYDEQLEAFEKEADAEMSILKKNHQDKLSMYKTEYMEKLKSVDEERYNQIKAIDDQIEAIKDLSKQEKKAKKESEQQQKMDSLNSILARTETQEERERIEKQIAEFQAELDEERIQEEREKQIEQLEFKKDNINEEYDAKKEAIQEEYEDRVNTENDVYQKELSELTEAQKARRAIIQETYQQELEDLREKQKEEDKLFQKQQKAELEAINERQQNEREKLSERQQNESEALSERQQEARDALSERQSAEKEALAERHSAEMEAMNASHQTALANIESEKNAKIEALNAAAAKDVKPTTLEDVNAALDELNEYADKTIYNFADMTHNIGTFTAAGVDLETSVDAIKGIANLAAMSGTSSEKASNAMYQLSQAIASGTVRYQDWMSVMHSDMGGETFQNALKETARVHGIAVDDMIAKNGSFQYSLQEGWLTSEILLETLSKFTGDLTEEQLRSMGYTEDQIKDIIQMGQTAVEAATKVRTWSQLIDTTKEALGSGWAETFEIVIGDFDEATELWSGISEIISAAVDKQADARNELLQGWKDAGGRDLLIQSFENLWKGLEKIIHAIQLGFRDIFPKTTSKTLLNFTEGFEKLTSKLTISYPTFFKVRKAVSGFASVIKLGIDVVKSFFQVMSPGVGVLGKVADAVLDFSAKVGEWITNSVKAAEANETFTKAFTWIRDAVSETYDDISNFISLISEWVKTKFKAPDVSFITDFGKNVEKAGKPIEGFLETIRNGFGKALKLLEPVRKTFEQIGAAISKTFKEEGIPGVIDFIERFVSGGVITALGLALAKLSSNLGKVADSASKVLDRIKSGISGTFKAIQNEINAKALKEIAAAMLVLVGALAVLALIPEDKLGPAVLSLGALLLGLTKVLETLSKSIKDEKAVARLSTTMLSLSASVLLLAVAVKKLAGFDPVNMAASTAAIVLLTEEMARVMKNFEQDQADPKKFKKSATTMIAMAAGVLILSNAVEKLAKLNIASLAKGAGSVAALMAAVALMEKYTKDSSFSASNGIGILALATSMLVFQKAVEAFGKMDPATLEQGAVAVGGLIVVLGAFEAMAGSAAKGFSSAAGTIAIAAGISLLIKPLKELGQLEFNVLVQGLGAIGIALAEFAITVRVMEGTEKASLGILAISAAMLVFTPVLKILSSMNLISLGIALTALAGSLTVIGVAAKILKPYTGTFIELAKGVALFGVALLGIGAGVALFATGLATLAASGAAAAVALIAVIKSLVQGILEAMNESMPLLIETLKNLILGLIDAAVEIIPQMADGAFQIIVGVLDSLQTYIPTIVTTVVTFLTTVINTLADHIPELVTAVIDLLAAFFASITEALRDMDTQTLQDALVGAGILGGIMIAMAGLSAIAGPAMTGIAEAGIMIGELTALVAAIGAIGQIPGLKWLIGEGGEILLGLGNAIGNFAGGIIGGLMEGVSSSFPQIATDLADFATNLQPFLTQIKNVDSDALAAVGSLGEMVLKLTAADILSGIKKFFSMGQGGSSFGDFAEELTVLGPKIKDFSDSVTGIDSDAVQAAADAASIITSVANNLPKTGGFWQKLVGETTTLSTFAEQLEAFGPAIKGYSDTVSGGIDEDAVTSSANAAKIIAEMATNLPKTGGFWQKFFGESISLSTFGEQMEAFGPSIKAFSDSVAGGIDETAVSSATNAALALAGLANNLPESGGFLQDFFGEQNLETFGTQLESFGQSMKKYSDAITDGDGFDAEAATASANAGMALANLADSLPDAKGIFSVFTGEQDLQSFGENLAKFGESLKGYYDSISSINTTQMDSIITEINNLVDIATAVKDVDTKKLKSFGSNMKKMAEDGLTEFTNTFIDSESSIDEALNKMLGYVTSALDEKEKDMKTAGQDIGKKVGTGLNAGLIGTSDTITLTTKSLAETVVSTLEKHLPEKTFKSDGANAMSALGSGITSKINSLIQIISSVTSIISARFSTALPSSNFKTIGSNIVTGLGNGMSGENGRKAASTATTLASAVYTNIKNGLKYENFVTIGGNVATGLSNGMTQKSSVVSTAAANLAKAATTSTTVTLQTNSPSKVFEGIGENVGQGLADGMANKMHDVGKTARKLAENAMAEASALDNKKAKSRFTALSKDFQELAKLASNAMTSGMAEDIQKVADTASASYKNAMETLSKMTNAANKKAYEKLASNFQTLGKTVTDALTGSQSKVLDAATTATQVVSQSSIDSVGFAIEKIEDVTDSFTDLDPTITPVVDLSNVSSSVDDINSMYSGIDLGTTNSLAQSATNTNAVIGSEQGARLIEGQDRILHTMQDFMQEIKQVMRETQVPNNIFNISSQDPRQTASEVDRILQRQVERRKAVWG